MVQLDDPKFLDRTKADIDAESLKLRAEYGRLFDVVEEILFRYDPIGINFEHNTDEYRPEVETILPRLQACYSASDVTVVVYQEFVRWFDEDTAGPEGRYAEPAREIWAVWQNFLSES